jgi:putative addiction module killer protein
MITWTVIEYTDEQEESPFAKWFSRINAQAAARISTALYRLGQGNLSNTRSVGKGVFEYKVDFGPGYRIYFGRDGNRIIVLLTGGTKKQQGKDIRKAYSYWTDYKRQKRHQLR